MNQQTNKVAIIGCGKVGMTAAFSILHDGIVDELILFGRSKSDLVGEQLDLEHGLSFLHHAKVKSTVDYRDLAGCDLVVMTAGAAQKPGETRLDLTKNNIRIVEEVIPRIVAATPNSVILIVSNPVDVLTYKAYLKAGLPKGRVFGSGTTLDTARFRFHLSEFLNINPRSIHTYILGEHGDNSFPAISSATIGGQPLMSMPNFSEQKAFDAYEKAKLAAYRIIESKGATYYAIGVVIAHIVKSVLKDSRSVLPVSIPLHNYHGINGIAMSVPCIIGKHGVEETLQIKLSWEEKKKLEAAAVELKKYL
jgi:L-lactate dehydrogenase